MKRKTRKLFKWIRAHWSNRIAVFIVLLTLSLFSAWRIYSLFSPESAVLQNQYKVIPNDGVLQELAGFMNVSPQQLYAPGLPPIDNALYVNTRAKALLFQPVAGSKYVTIPYEGANPLVKTPAASADQAFDQLMTERFHLQGYQDMVTAGNPPDSDAMLQVAASIGANPEFTRKILSGGHSDVRTILFSMLYNTILSGTDGHIVTLVSDGKMKAQTSKTFTVDVIDSSRLGDGLARLEGEAENDEVKYINEQYNRIHAEKETPDTGMEDFSLQKKLNTLFGKRAITLNSTTPFPFVYVNFKRNILYCGDNSYPYDAGKLQALDNNAVSTFFEKQFGLTGLATADPVSLPALARKMGIPADSIETRKDVSNAQALFKDLLDYVLDHPSVYFIANGKLQQYDNSKINAPFGKFDPSLLEAGISHINEALTTTPDMVIARRPADVPIVLYVTIFILLLTAGIPLVIARQPKRQDELPAAAMAGKPEDEPLKMAIPEPEVVEPKAPDPRVLFYKQMENCRQSSDLLRLLDAEHNMNRKIPKIASINDIFEKADQEQSDAEKVLFILAKFDESPTGRQRKQNLREKFNELQKASDQYAKLDQLLVDRDHGDIFNYLVKAIQKVLDEPGLQASIGFTTLFQSPDKRMPKGADELLAENSRMQASVSAFREKHRKLAGQNLLDRTAILCWAVELANELMRIGDQSFAGFDIEKIKQDQLQLIFTKYFISVGSNPEKNMGDFEKSISDGHARIAELNALTNDKTAQLDIDMQTENNNVLKELMGKIKRQDETVIFFEKMYQHFVREFNDRIDNLKFTRTELNPEDSAWLFQSVFNIAFHTAEYTEHFIRKDEDYYHPNYLLLRNDLDINKASSRDFIENDMEKSTRGSNAIAKAARSVRIRRLDFLVNKYYIKPEQLA